MASAPKSAPTEAASQFGDIYRAISALRDAANELSDANDNDEPAGLMAGRAGTIRRRATQLETVLDEISTSLQGLEI